MLLVKMEEKLLACQMRQKKTRVFFITTKSKKLEKSFHVTGQPLLPQPRGPSYSLLTARPRLELDVLCGLARTENSNTCIA